MNFSLSPGPIRQWRQVFMTLLLAGWLSTVQAGIKISGAGSIAGIESSIRELLAGSGVTISNINVLRLPGVDQWGAFRNGMADASPNIGIDQGVVISTGLAYTLEQSSKDPYGYSYGRSHFDPDLGSLLESVYDQRDSVIVTFDLVPATDTLAIDFVYGSDEYQKYVNSGYVDAFGIFVSGPGIRGEYSNQAVNLAVLPNGTPAIGKHVNQFRNTDYYIPNPAVTYDSAGHSSLERGNYIALNGWTKRVTGSVQVQPGHTYQVKMALGEGQDGYHDTSVFLAPFISDRKKHISTIHVMVWHDLDGDGQRVDGEPPLEGVTVTLVPENDPGQTTAKITDSVGSALFKNIANGGYWVEVPAELDQQHGLLLGDSSPSPEYINVIQSANYGAFFGYVHKPAAITLVPEYRQSTAPGLFVRFSHRLASSRGGAAILSSQWLNDDGLLDEGTTVAWPVTLEQLDCNSDSDQGIPITGSLSVDPDQPLCFQAFFFVPEETPQGVRRSLAISANIVSSDRDTPPEQARVIDQVTVSDEGSGRLWLQKQVTNKTLNGSRGITIEGGSGDFLIYTIRFRNIGAGSLADLKILDEIPAFTHLSQPAVCPLASDLPAGLGACMVQTPGADNDTGFQGQVIWRFGGSLPPGAGGEVSYELMVE